MSENKHLLEVEDLHVSFFTPAGEVKAVGGISYTLDEDEVMGIVGESGSGKSQEAYAIMGLLQSPGKVIGGSIIFEGEDVLAKTKKEMTELRGGRAAMIFQNPMTSLNPVYTIGNQLVEALRAHDKAISKEDAAQRAMEMLTMVGINNVEQRMKQYPHELSGGMRQRVMIAMALSCKPKLLIADEPTTALDVTIQAQIMKLLGELRREKNMAMILITHDIGVVANMADRVIVMYAGQIVEEAPVLALFDDPKHPYTRALLDTVPTIRDDESRQLTAIPGMVPENYDDITGCRFADRCPYRQQECDSPQELYRFEEGHAARCIVALRKAGQVGRE